MAPSCHSHSQTKQYFHDEISKMLDQYCGQYENVILIGDFNWEIGDEVINDFVDSYELASLVRSPTCFMSDSPRCIDLLQKKEGYDDIPVSLIIDGAAQISGPLSNLINRCLRQSVFPTAEKWAKVTPVYKSGEQSLMGNYRPISVLPVLSKVFE